METGDKLRIGDNIKVILVGGEEKYYTITAIDDIYYEDEFSEISASSTEDYATVDDLNPPRGQLYWINHIGISGNVKLYLKQPTATNRLGTNKSPEGGILLDTHSPVMGGRSVDIWIVEDYEPSVKLVNGTNVACTPTLWWTGKRFGTKELSSKPAVFSTIRIGGLSE